MILIILFIIIDQYGKYLSFHHAFSNTQFPLFNLTLIKNPGVTLGFLGNTSWLFITILQILLLIWIMTLKPPKITKKLILSGGISNIIDRLYYGFIIDYIQFHIGIYQWPTVVNLADIYLFLAFILWLYHLQHVNEV